MNALREAAVKFGTTSDNMKLLISAMEEVQEEAARRTLRSVAEWMISVEDPDQVSEDHVGPFEVVVRLVGHDAGDTSELIAEELRKLLERRNTK